MRMKIFILCMIFLGFANNIQAQKNDVIFYVVYRYTGTDDDVKFLKGTGANNIFGNRFTAGLKENFPCADEIEDQLIYALLDQERKKQLLGAGSDQAMNDIRDAHDIDYLVAFELGVFADRLIVSSTCTPYRTQERTPIIRKTTTTSFSKTSTTEITAACKDVADKMIEALKKYEICPFKGPVTLTKTSTLDSVNTLQYNVYCNEMDQQYIKKTETHNSSYSEWKLERKGIPRTDGTMTFHATEESEVNEQDGCHQCKSGRSGGRIFTEKRSMEVRGSGISQTSFYNGKAQYDTRIDLEFLEDGTYIMIVKATSLPVTGTDNVTTHAEGTCDNIPLTTIPEPREIKIPLMMIFGPYTGDASSKVLHERDSKEVNDPITGEKTTITIDFTLTHD